MFIAFALEAAGILALGAYGRDPLLFVLLGGMVFFAWGRDLQPVPLHLHRRLRHQVRHDQCRPLYTAKGVAGLLVLIASLLAAETGNWHAVFVAAVLMTALAAVLAILVLRPMRLAMQGRPVPLAAAPPAMHQLCKSGLGFAVRLWQKYYAIIKSRDWGKLWSRTKRRP